MELLKLGVWSVRLLLAVLIAWPVAHIVGRWAARRAEGSPARLLGFIGATTTSASIILACATVIFFFAYGWLPPETRHLELGLSQLDALMELCLAGVLSGIFMSARASLRLRHESGLETRRPMASRSTAAVRAGRRKGVR